jgi:hypothetical protein
MRFSLNISIFAETLILKNMSSPEHANDERHYILITIAIIIILVGVFFRFAAAPGDGHPSVYNWISNTVLVIGVAVGLKGVFSILE